MKYPVLLHNVEEDSFTNTAIIYPNGIVDYFWVDAWKRRKNNLTGKEMKRMRFLIRKAKKDKSVIVIEIK